MGFFDKIGGFFKGVGKGLGKAFGVVTAPIKDVWGFVKDTASTIVHMPEKVLASVDKATGVVGGLGNNVERSVGSASNAITSVGNNAENIAHDVKDGLGGLGGHANDALGQPIMWGALGIAALFVLRS